MAGERGYTLSEDAAKRTGNAVRWVEGQRKPEVGGRRRRPIMDDSSGGGGALIVFTLSEFAEDIDCDAGSAIATVEYVMSGATVSVGDTIVVCDPVGCNLVGSEYLLLGKRGWAAPLVGLSCTSPDPYQDDLPSFAIINLCPSDFSCGG